MAIRGGYARAPKIQAEFTTDQYTLSMTNVTSTTDTDRLVSGGMTNGIISFTTTNDMNEDSATFSIVAVGTKRWDKLLEPNDIITLRVNPGDGNPVENDVVMVGMISADFGPPGRRKQPQIFLFAEQLAKRGNCVAVTLFLCRSLCRRIEAVKKRIELSGPELVD